MAYNGEIHNFIDIFGGLKMRKILKYAVTFLMVYALAFVLVKVFAGAAFTSPVGALAALLAVGYIYYKEAKEKEKDEEKEEKR